MNGQELALNPTAISAASSVLAPLVMISPIACDIISSTLRDMEVDEYDQANDEDSAGAVAGAGAGAGAGGSASGVNTRNAPFNGIVRFLGESIES